MPATPYEHPDWQALPGQVMRPGGLMVTQRALSYCTLRPGMRVLDLGCGLGKALQHIAAAQQVAGFGIDISNELLLKAQAANPSLGFALARGESLPFTRHSVDLLLAECVLSLVQMDRALGECARVIKPGGFLVIDDVYARNEDGLPALRRFSAGSCVGGAVSREAILEAVERHGLRISVFQDCSEHLKHFPLCDLVDSSASNSLDLFLAAARAKLGYYFLVATKV